MSECRIDQLGCVLHGFRDPECKFFNHDEPPAPRAGEREHKWQRRDNEIFIHREMTPSELVKARAKGFRTTDIRYTVARFYGDNAEQNAQQTIDSYNQYATLVAQRDDFERRLRQLQEHVKTKLAWHRDGVGPDIPVLQERYDNLIAEHNELREQWERLLEIVKGFRRWLVMTNSDGTEYTVWPERVTEIDAALATIEQEGEA